MFTKLTSDGNVWFALGLLCLSLGFLTEGWAGGSSVVEFGRGLLFGLAAAASVISVVLHLWPSKPNKQS